MDGNSGHGDGTLTLWVRGQPVSEYVVDPRVDPTVSPRPYLHPVRTLAGVVVTDAGPADHRWHLGASLAVPDVAGTNLWGGRSYVRDAGYIWRGNHGRIEHIGFLARTDAGFTQQLRWCDTSGETLLWERRRIAARPLPGHDLAWVLDVAYRLTAPPTREVTLGSPATNGRPGGTGYGGFFWRAAASREPPRVFTATSANEHTVNGATADWVALASTSPPYTLVFTGLPAGDHWFVRAREYPGVCAAFAFEKPRVIGAGESMSGRHAVVVADAVLSPHRAGELATAAADPAEALRPPI